MFKVVATGKRIAIDMISVPEDEVEAHYSFRLRGLLVVQHRGLSFGPNKSSVFSQEAVMTGAYLTFGDHCGGTVSLLPKCSEFFCCTNLSC